MGTHAKVMGRLLSSSPGHSPTRFKTDARFNPGYDDSANRTFTRSHIKEAIIAGFDVRNTAVRAIRLDHWSIEPEWKEEISAACIKKIKHAAEEFILTLEGDKFSEETIIKIARLIKEGLAPKGF